MTTLVCIAKHGEEYTYGRWVGKIETHRFGSSVPLDQESVERIRNDPVQFQNEVEEAEQAGGPPEAA